jgi:hypothetical protein
MEFNLNEIPEAILHYMKDVPDQYVIWYKVCDEVKKTCPKLNTKQNAEDYFFTKALNINEKFQNIELKPHNNNYYFFLKNFETKDNQDADYLKYSKLSNELILKRTVEDLELRNKKLTMDLIKNDEICSQLLDMNKTLQISNNKLKGQLNTYDTRTQIKLYIALLFAGYILPHILRLFI